MRKDKQKMTPVVSGALWNVSGKILDPEQKMKLASYHAKLILGSYRADQANDPEIYLTAIGHLLSSYSPDVGARLSDPKNGIAGKYKFLPTVSEVHEEADKLVKEDAKPFERAANIKQQLEEREQREIENRAVPLEQRRKVVDRIMREMKQAFTENQGEYNVFVPTFAPQHSDMVARGGRPGVSLEDKNRTGVWVPLEWLQKQQSKKDTWQKVSGHGEQNQDS